MVGKMLLISALALFAGGATASPRQLFERATCNRDNLFRCFIDERYSTQASSFCSGLSPFTTTVATTVATTTTTVQTQVTEDAITSTVILTTTIFTETVPSSTTTLTLGVGTVAKRQATASPPKCMTNGVTYPASRITSACSCIDMPAATVSLTYTASTETVTITETSYTTPLVTTTTWSTVATDTTAGVYTVTVGPPSPTNRIINGDFETGDSSGWQLLPASWTGAMSTSNFVPTSGTWSYKVTGSGDSLGSLYQAESIYMEAGQYQVGVTTTPLVFPYATGGWGGFAVFQFVNPQTGTNITVTLPSGTKKIVNKAYAVPLQQNFEIPEDAAGYNQVAIRYLTATPPAASIDGIFLQKAS